jgi:toxin-antitoxin system PIN domain toxin
VILVDANIPLYAYDSGSPRHGPARAWLERTLSNTEDVRFALVTLLAFVRIATNSSVFARPMDPGTALAHVGSWLGRPNVSIATPSERHWTVLAEVAAAGQARGPLMMDAHLAALAVEHGATLMTTDRGFARFPRLRFRDPIGD